MGEEGVLLFYRWLICCSMTAECQQGWENKRKKYLLALWLRDKHWKLTFISAHCFPLSKFFQVYAAEKLSSEKGQKSQRVVGWTGFRFRRFFGFYPKRWTSHSQQKLNVKWRNSDRSATFRNTTLKSDTERKQKGFPAIIGKINGFSCSCSRKWKIDRTRALSVNTSFYSNKVHNTRSALNYMTHLQQCPAKWKHHWCYRKNSWCNNQYKSNSFGRLLLWKKQNAKMERD